MTAFGIGVPVELTRVAVALKLPPSGMEVATAPLEVNARVIVGPVTGVEPVELET